MSEIMFSRNQPMTVSDVLALVDDIKAHKNAVLKEGRDCYEAVVGKKGLGRVFLTSDGVAHRETATLGILFNNFEDRVGMYLSFGRSDFNAFVTDDICRKDIEEFFELYLVKFTRAVAVGEHLVRFFNGNHPVATVSTHDMTLYTVPTMM